MKKKRDFEGEKIIVLPPKIKKALKNNSLTNYLYITDIGFYPHGENHFRERKHGSSEHILIYCVDGKGWINYHDNKQTLTSNCYSIIPKNTAHTYAADAKTPWSIYWIHFNGEKADSFVYPLDYPRTLELSKNSRFEDRIQLFEEIYFNLETDYSNTTMEYSSILLMHLLGSFKYISQFQTIRKKEQEDPVLKAIFYMKTHLDKKITVQEIAAFCNISVSHFCLLFKKQTTYTPIEHLIFLRMQKACYLLEFSHFKIHQIGLKVGYDDAFYFSRVFKNVMGKSPVLYRKDIEKR